jgi:hypothetical protein
MRMMRMMRMIRMIRMMMVILGMLREELRTRHRTTNSANPFARPPRFPPPDGWGRGACDEEVDLLDSVELVRTRPSLSLASLSIIPCLQCLDGIDG